MEQRSRWPSGVRYFIWMLIAVPKATHCETNAELSIFKLLRITRSLASMCWKINLTALIEFGRP